uniref:Potassium channel domain-containing protein n=1 Tax=Ascaris lumbricoides TaxID=6252 RepID=A0A9J2P7J6_ASCLU
MPLIFQHLKWAYQKFHLNYTLPFVILVSYTLIGAAIFRNLELERDQMERETFRISYDYAMNQLLRRMLEVRCYDAIVRMDEQLQMNYTSEAIHWFIDYLNLTAVIKERNDSSPWSWYGYGLPVAKTRAGQIASIFYIMIGIPIFLIILKDVGRLLSKTLRKLYKRVRTARSKLPTRQITRISIPVKALYTSAYSIANSVLAGHKKLSPLEMDAELAANEQNELNKKLSRGNAFPIPIALAILILWIGFSAALFCLWETEWGYLTSVYFFFVSISTVGLGDIVPANKDMMLLNFVLILIGLALLSMCINLIQVAIEKVIDQLLQQYISEIERVAAMVHNNGEFDGEETTNFEIGMAADFMAVPFIKPQKSILGFPRAAKDWLAGKIANNLISSRLEASQSDEESENESHASARSPRHGRLMSITMRRMGERLQCSRPAIKAVQAIEKARLDTNEKDFQSIVFSKFLTNSKLERLVQQYYEEQPTTASKAVQTEPLLKHLLASPELELTLLEDSKTSVVDEGIAKQLYESTSTFGMDDDDSMVSKAYYDAHLSDTYASPHSSVDVIMQTLKRSQLSLEYADEQHSDTCHFEVPTIQTESRSSGQISGATISSLHRSDSSCVFSVPFADFERSRDIIRNRRCASCCHVPGYSQLRNIPPRRRSLDAATNARLRYLVGILPDDFALTHLPETFERQLRHPENSVKNHVNHLDNRVSGEDAESFMGNLLGTLQYEDTFYCT